MPMAVNPGRRTTDNYAWREGWRSKEGKGKERGKATERYIEWTIEKRRGKRGNTRGETSRSTSYETRKLYGAQNRHGPIYFFLFSSKPYFYSTSFQIYNFITMDKLQKKNTRNPGCRCLRLRNELQSWMRGEKVQSRLVDRFDWWNRYDFCVCVYFFMSA